MNTLIIIGVLFALGIIIKKALMFWAVLIRAQEQATLHMLPCRVCGRLRLRDALAVETMDMSSLLQEPKGTSLRRIRYCTDSNTCFDKMLDLKQEMVAELRQEMASTTHN